MFWQLIIIKAQQYDRIEDKQARKKILSSEVGEGDTGSWRGVHLHFLRRLNVRRRGGAMSAVGKFSSSARAAASVAKLSKSKVNLSSPAGTPNYQNML